MARRLKIKTHELGDLELFVIYQEGSEWEREWKPLQGLPIASLLTNVPKSTWDHALRGWTSPLVKSLGIVPQGALIKIPDGGTQCFRKKDCPFFRKKDCVSTGKATPLCFEPQGVEDDQARKLASALVRLWREGVYILVVMDV